MRLKWTSFWIFLFVGLTTLLGTPVLAQVFPWADVRYIEWSPSGETLGVASMDGLLLLDDGLQLIAHIHSGRRINTFDWSPLGDRLALTLSNKIEIWSWDPVAGSLDFMRELEAAHTTYAVLWSPDGERLAALRIMERPDPPNKVGSFRIWDATTWQVEQDLGSFVYTLDDELGLRTAQFGAWAPDGSPVIATVGVRLRSADEDYHVDGPRGVYLLDVESGEVQVTPMGSTQYATSLSWQPGGSLIAVGSKVGAKIYDVSVGNYLHNIGSTLTYSVRWDPTGTYIARATEIAVGASNVVIGSLTPTRGAASVDWKPDGFTLTSVGFDDTILNTDSREIPGFVPITPTPTP